jgi:putative transposase
MPRKARLIAPGVAHHITQRGINRQLVFFTKQDRRVYLQLLKENSRQARLSIWLIA